ncbi:MAG: AAA family ATPase [Acidimicrobiales bacterium]
MKPRDVFDRDHEWDDLDRFVSAQRAGTSLGLVYGRRRQGKTYLLEALSETFGGVYFAALQQSPAQNLARLAEAYRASSGSGGRVVFDEWESALSSLLSLGDRAGAPVPIVIDELPYLLEGAPQVPSVLQSILRPRSAAAQRYSTRLILCGSAMSTMRGLLAGSAPLRGRASLEMMVHPFSYREAARFWGIEDPQLALMLHALVGGTPAYRDMCASAPSSVSQLERWISSTLLNPASAMFREGRVLLAEESRVADSALYFAVLAAISQGATRRGEIASLLGRSEQSLVHPITVLTDAQLIEPLSDALRQRRTTYHVAEPVLRFHELVIAPNEPRLLRRLAAQVWREVSDTVSSKIYGPHFEHLARLWCLEHASEKSLGGTASEVAPTVVACREHAGGHEVDAVVLESEPGQRDRITAIGEAKWRTARAGIGQLERLEHVRTLLHAESAKLLLFSRSGFTPSLTDGALARRDVELVDLPRLYGGA